MRRLIFIVLTITYITGCTNISENNNTQTINYATIDSIKEITVNIDSLIDTIKNYYVPDTTINEAANFYAGLYCDTNKVTKVKLDTWEKYSQQIKSQTKTSLITLQKIDSLIKKDMSDIQNLCNYVFYPFSGPDFLYPITIVPNADTYFLIGLESTGTINTDLNSSPEFFNLYTRSLAIYMRSSFFRTLSMKEDFNNEQINGTIPVLSMLMAIKDCKIVSINYKYFTEEGIIADTNDITNLVEIQFFKDKTPLHLQTLYYLSTNLYDGAIDKKFVKYCDNTLSLHKTLTFLKAASYLLHENYFSKIRNIILDNSSFVIEDDSGIPYRHFKDNWNVTLYGTYIKPLSIFKEKTFQLDLLEQYNSDSVKKLPIRIGYNNPSNWLCARILEK
ncbi:MAG: hypothetical protein MJ204_05710 [Bacteroidales bacterium]|nr:hypothetical protein [Bacteroidales bacterium]